MERASVEVWQQILLKVMETNDWPIFTTSCTPYTFLGFTYLHNWLERDKGPYLDYLAQRRRLRLVCRAWNEFVLLTSHRWLLLEDHSPMCKLDSTTIRAKGGVGPTEILSTEIFQNELVTPILTWASHILKRPASQSPLRSYILYLGNAHTMGYNPLDLLVGTTTTQDPACTNTNTTLRLLSISGLSNNSISFSQISRTFTGLRSLFLSGLTAVPQQPLTLAHLEVLYVQVMWEKWEDLQRSFETWHTPALRHVRLSHFRTQLTDLIDCFLGRYAHQIESLVLSAVKGYYLPCLDLPSGFWAQFTALRLLGLSVLTLQNTEWSGWSVVPPPTHPCRYLLCHFYCPVESAELDRAVEWVVNYIRARWTWDDGVKLVVGHVYADQFYVVKNIRGDPSIANMERNVRVLPEL